jgi:hypothetical protein
MQALHKIAMPSLLKKTVSRKAMATKNEELCRIAKAARVELEKKHMQMVLMDKENGRLHQQLHAKKNKVKRTYMTSHAWLMIGEEM